MLKKAQNLSWSELYISDRWVCYNEWSGFMVWVIDSLPYLLFLPVWSRPSLRLLQPGFSGLDEQKHLAGTANWFVLLTTNPNTITSLLRAMLMLLILIHLFKLNLQYPLEFTLLFLFQHAIYNITSLVCGMWSFSLLCNLIELSLSINLLVKKSIFLKKKKNF